MIMESKNSNTIETSPPENGTKAKPVSAFTKGEYSSPEELSKICFSSSPLISTSPKVVSVSNGEPPRLSAKKNILGHVENQESSLYSFMPDGTPLPILRTSDSRQGRDHQRWDVCKDTNNKIRLATGCIPITNDGRILFCSSSKKKEWILPKGGWEADEDIEMSAVREAYEEAGVLGSLGARLKDVTFETNKEKKRKQEFLKLKSQLSGIDQTTTIAPQAKKVIKLEENISSPVSALEHKSDVIIDENSHSPLKKKSHALVRVTFFILYISEVLQEWPESGRSRKILDIDEAITTVKREELKIALLELKQRGLHLITSKSVDATKDK